MSSSTFITWAMARKLALTRSLQKISNKKYFSNDLNKKLRKQVWFFLLYIEEFIVLLKLLKKQIIVNELQEIGKRLFKIFELKSKVKIVKTTRA